MSLQVLNTPEYRKGFDERLNSFFKSIKQKVDIDIHEVHGYKRDIESWYLFADKYTKFNTSFTYNGGTVIRETLYGFGENVEEKMYSNILEKLSKDEK